MSKENLVIIDSSSILYKITAVLSRDEEKTDNFKEYKEGFKNYIEKILYHLDADKFILVGDGYTSFRKEMFPTFKKNRVSRPLKFIRDLKNYCIDELNMVTSNELEADDLCLIYKNKYESEYAGVIVATPDSDIPQDAGLYYNYNWKHEDYGNKVVEVNDNKAIVETYKKILKGSHNNNKYSLAGCGEKTSEIFIDTIVKNYGYNERIIRGFCLDAFINGISKEDYKIKRSVNGYGPIEGPRRFANSIIECRLLRDVSEYSIKEIPTEKINSWKEIKRRKRGEITKEEFNLLEDIL